MKIIERIIGKNQEDAIIFEYKELTKELSDIKNYILRKDTQITVYADDKSMKVLPVDSILYFEAVKELVFAYTKEGVYEVKMRLYQVEEMLDFTHVMRASKSFLINLVHIMSVRPALNGRFLALMDNGEEVMISRQYAKSITECILNGTTAERRPNET